MGAASSKAASTAASARATGILLTLDAFGTIYRPRRPIAEQYLQIARQVFDSPSLSSSSNAGPASPSVDIGSIDSAALDRSFRRAFKAQQAQNPNYGRAAGMTSEQWWSAIVHDAFSEFVPSSSQPILAELAPRLYRHFSSDQAYELFPDVAPFFTQIRNLRDKYSSLSSAAAGRDTGRSGGALNLGPSIFVGVVSNSDDRVKGILQSLGLRCGILDAVYVNGGELEQDTREAARFLARHVRSGSGQAPTGDGGPGGDQASARLPRGLSIYNPADDVNFVVTSYQHGYEKPAPEIFGFAAEMPRLLMMSRAMSRNLQVEDERQKQLEEEEGDDVEGRGRRKFPSVFSQIASTIGGVWGASLQTPGSFINIHVGDDYDRDYVGAKAFRGDGDRSLIGKLYPTAGFDALQLCRGVKEDEKQEHQIADLDELSRLITMLAEFNFEPPPK